MMKFIVFLALVLAMMACLAKAQSVTEVALAPVYVVKAQPLNNEEAQGHALELEQHIAYCNVGQCNRNCAIEGKSGHCSKKAKCKCY